MANAIAAISTNQDVYILPLIVQVKRFKNSINSFTLFYRYSLLNKIFRRTWFLKGRHSKLFNRENIRQYVKPKKICKRLFFANLANLLNKWIERLLSWYVHLTIVLSPLKSRLFIDVYIFLMKIKRGHKLMETLLATGKAFSILCMCLHSYKA